MKYVYCLIASFVTIFLFGCRSGNSGIVHVPSSASYEANGYGGGRPFDPAYYQSNADQQVDGGGAPAQSSADAPAQVVGWGADVANSQLSAAVSAALMPKAVIYKTNGDYADHVFINISGNRIVSYPAPTDVDANSAPLPVGDGWLLDRRGGIGTNSVFTTYTYSQYHALSQVPSPSQLRASVIPQARVTAVRQLPITLQQALADPEVVKKYISEK